VDEYESELERLDRAVIQTASVLAELLVMARWSEITSRTPGRTPYEPDPQPRDPSPTKINGIVVLRWKLRRPLVGALDGDHAQVRRTLASPPGLLVQLGVVPAPGGGQVLEL
jgi:hypothetical protein